MVGIVLLAAVVQAYLTITSGWWSGFFFACLAAPTLSVLVFVREVTKNILAKNRMWEWLRYKFNSWEEVQEWLILTPGWEIDAILDLGHDRWVPKKGGGYEVVV